MKYFSLITSFCFTLLFVSCVGGNDDNDEVESNEIDKVAQAAFYQNVFNDDQIPEQDFLIQADRDTLLVAENGTQFKIFANTFNDANGNLVEGDIEIEVKEAFEMIDIIMGNLTTTDDGEFLQTDGMVYINATQNNLKLNIGDDKSVGIIVKTDDVDPGMQIFRGNREDGQIGWSDPKEPLNEVMQQVTQENNWVWYNYEGMDSIEMERYYKDSIIDWFWSPEREIGDVHRSGSKKVWIVDFTTVVDTIKFKEMEDGLFIQDVVTNRGSNSYIQDFNTSYIFTIKELGWANIDRFYYDSNAQEVDLMVAVSNEPEFGYVYTTLILQDEDMYLPGYQRNDGTFGFTQKDWEVPVLPFNSEAILLATAYKDDKPYYGIKQFTIKAEVDLSVELQVSNTEEMKLAIESALN